MANSVHKTDCTIAGTATAAIAAEVEAIGTDIHGVVGIRTSHVLRKTYRIGKPNCAVTVDILTIVVSIEIIWRLSSAPRERRVGTTRATGYGTVLGIGIDHTAIVLLQPINLNKDRYFAGAIPEALHLHLGEEYIGGARLNDVAEVSIAESYRVIAVAIHVSGGAGIHEFHCSREPCTALGRYGQGDNVPRKALGKGIHKDI